MQEDNVKETVEAMMMLVMNGQWTEVQEEQYNKIDQQLVLAKQNAEQKCWKIRAGQTPWMLALTQTIQRVLY